MDRSTALQLAADELEERELRKSPIEIIDYVPSDPARGLLTPPGSIMVFLDRAGAPVLDRIRQVVLDGSGEDVRLAQEIRDLFAAREKVSYYRAYRLLREAESFATIRYGGRTLVTHAFPAPEAGLAAIENPYNGGRLAPDELTLVEHLIPGARGGLAAVAVRHMPPLTEAERAAVEQVPDDQLEMNLTLRAGCCDSWTGFVEQLAQITHATMYCMMEAAARQDAPLPPGEIERLGPAASARRLLNRRRELLGHDHA
ncbi:hypothetical protein [Streptomyces phytophilus]|uniref:hypothetical protein n=1 Tax=Streptomyces phytophilus TaxID=722715 RepID=UPI0015EFE43A|nr:hypothetical protein [Streptomyces phytophilus]